MEVKDRVVYMIAIIAAMGGLLFGFDTGIIADGKWLITEEFSLTNFQWSLLVSSTIFGAFLSALFSGRFLDYVGRKSALMVIALFFIFGTIIASLAYSFKYLIIGRSILGLCIGISSFSAPLFISEVAPIAKRGRLVLFNNIALTGGECIAFLTGYLLHDICAYAWRVMFFLGIVPALVMFIGLFFIPESPRWLAEKYGIFPTNFILNKIRKGYSVRSKVKESVAIKSSIESFVFHFDFVDMFRRPTNKVLCIGLFLGVLQQFAGINAVMYYGPFVFHEVGFSKSFSLFSTFIMGLLNTFFTLFAMMVVDNIGRRLLLIFGSLVSGISLLIFSIHSYFFVSSPWISLISIIFFVVAYSLSFGCIFWLVISEIYPLRIRASAMSFVTAFQWLANFIVSLAFLPLYNLIGGEFTVLIFSFFCFFTVLFSLKYLPETKGVSLEMIERNLLSGKKSGELGR
jgi:sugar porter (SP) family MFS transporter